MGISPDLGSNFRSCVVTGLGVMLLHHNVGIFGRRHDAWSSQQVDGYDD
jgi:hypothetical protein